MAVISQDGIHLLQEARAIVTRPTTNYQPPIGSVSSVTIQGRNGSRANIMGWGADNDLPAMRERLIADNNIVPSLIATRRDITLGLGLYTYEESYEIVDGKRKRIINEVPMPAQMKAFFDKIDVDQYLLTSAKNLIIHSMIPTEYRRNVGGDIIDMKALECRHIRAEEMDDMGRINNWYWSGMWGHQRDKEHKALQPAQQIPVYQEGAEQRKFILVIGDDLLCLDEYYFSPYWWGSEEWIRLANCIPAFHQANLDHGYSIRYHVEIPKDYFRNKSAQAQSPELKAEQDAAEDAARKAFLDRMNKFLAGVTKAGRTVVTEYEVNKAMGKEFPGIKIKPLDINLQDEALLKLFEKSNQANISSQGIHPTLANIETQGRLSSGSEIRNAYAMYLAIKTPLPRKILLKPFQVLKKEMGWPEEIKFGFRDLEITTLDEEKTGQREKTMQPE